MEIDLSSVISAVGAIIAAYFSYNQYHKNKMADIEAKYKEKELEQRSYQKSRNSAKIFGELWKVLYAVKADRVYIVQPHPLGHSAYLSVQFEVKRNGIDGMMMNIQKLPMSEVCVFCDKLQEDLWQCYTNIDEQITDKIAKAMMMRNGTKNVAIKRLDSAVDWVGSIFCEFVDEDMKCSEEELHKVLHEVAMNIQYILPEFKEIKQ